MATILVHGCNPCGWLKSPCTSAILVHLCNHHAWLQALCMVAILADGCNHHAWLQYSCTAAILGHLRNHCAQLQSPCMAAILEDGCHRLAWLPYLRTAAVLMHSCAGVALSRCKGRDNRGLATSAGGQPHTYLTKQAGTTLLWPGQRDSPGAAVLGLEQALVSSSATPCRPPCTVAIY